jgi:hypothetical protein
MAIHEKQFLRALAACIAFHLCVGSHYKVQGLILETSFMLCGVRPVYKRNKDIFTHAAVWSCADHPCCNHIYIMTEGEA